jgi:hypothetical protein
MVVNGAPPLPKEDPLSSYTSPAPIVAVEPVNQGSNHDPLAQIPIQVESRVTPTPIEPVVSPSPVDSVPDWLKVPSVETSTALLETVEIPPAQEIESMSPLFEADTSTIAAADTTPLHSPTVVASDDSIPDWIKSTPSVIEAENVLNTISDNLGSTSIADALTPPVSEELPNWLMSSLQSDNATTDILPVASVEPVPTPESLIQ